MEKVSGTKVDTSFEKSDSPLPSQAQERSVNS